MQVFVDGVISGLTVAMLALAFAVVYFPTRVFHVALAGIYVAAPFVAWQCLAWGWEWPVSLFLAVLISVGISLSCEMMNHRILDWRQASSGAHIVSSLAIYIIVIQGVVLLWGSESKVLREGLDSVATIRGIIITRAQLGAATISILGLASLFAWLQYSNVGLQFRALADNPVELALRSHNTRFLRLLAFALSGILCSTSSLLVSYDVGFDAHYGLPAVLLAIVATIIGGRESFVGPVLGGIILGLLRAEVVWFFSARLQDAATFLLLAIFLLVRPDGLLPWRRKEARA